MKLLSVTVVACAISQAAGVVVAPPSGNCWASTRDIFQAEVAPMFNNVLRNTRRTYVLCPKTYTIGIMDRDFTPSVNSVGGDYPLMFANPNVEIVCQNPGTCIFSGGSEYVLNFVPLYITWIRLYLNSIGSQPLPLTFTADSSNLIIRGVTFTAFTAPFPYYTESPVSLLGPGNNMLFANCRWVAGSTATPAVSALTFTYNAPPGLRAGLQYYSTITLRNCTIQNNSFQYSVIRAIDGTGITPSQVTNVLTLDRVTITGNKVLSSLRNNPTPVKMSALFTVLNTKLVILNSRITGNSVSRANADINLVNSELFFDKSTMNSNPIATDLSPTCGSVQRYSGITTVVQIGCAEIGNGGTGTLSVGGGGAFVICFPGDAMAQVKGVGPIPMNQLAIGHQVLVDDKNNYEPIYSFGHTDAYQVADYLQLKTSSTTLEISKDHMVFIDGDNRAIPASQVQIGDKLVLESGKREPVTSITTAKRLGAFAPFTPSGTIVVNGVKASSYIAFQDSETLKLGGISTGVTYQWLAHTFELPHRLCYIMGLCNTEQYVNGISMWVDLPHRMITWWTSQNIFLQLLVLIPGGLLLAVTAVMLLALGQPVTLFFGGCLAALSLRYRIRSSTKC